ncbi:MAG: EAL domain-containing protein [Spirochaetia bacterium]|jgi:diguanylate cyclase (GGDEF)-like protein/PAS domain S-box-containing protein|nr:EAL domain-containing protein [Spirochaetia bacterium]
MQGKAFSPVDDNDSGEIEFLETVSMPETQDAPTHKKALSEERVPSAFERNTARRYKALFRGLVEHASDVVMILEADGWVRFCGPSTRSLLGYAPEHVEGTDFFSFLSDNYATEQRAMFSSNLVAEHPTFAATFSIKRSDDIELPVEARASNYLHNPDIAGVIMTLRDLTRQKKAEERALFYEYFDPLTSLPNRESFIRDVEKNITIANKRDRVFGVMALGLDRFKHVNDMYGTKVGDEVLKRSAEALRASFRNDDIVSRYRGDKFFMLFPEIKSQDHIKEIISKARTAFLDPINIGLGQELRLSASMGVAFFPNDGKEAVELVRNAETAMYMAKDSGRDGYRLFDAELDKELLERQHIENDLDEAIYERRFVPYFQPKVDRDGFIVGSEALVRWVLPNGDIKGPASFIEVAERSGNINRIGAIVILKTCKLAAEWSAEGLPDVPISINLSPRQFGQESLVEDIGAIIEATGVDPRRLEFEITESGIMTNERESISKLLRLKDMGLSISIDDFGTGYSSFSKLKDYPVDTVKMDKTFIDPLPEDRRAAIIASAIIDLAHTLSFTVIAEGVETYEQLNFLDTIFCDQFQGYLFSKPVPAEEFKRLLSDGKTLMPKRT